MKKPTPAAPLGIARARRNARWKAAFWLVLPGLLALAGCDRGKTITLIEMTKPATFTLTPGEGKSGRGITVHMRGAVYGKAVIWSIMATNKVSGNFEINHQDNFSTNLTVYYVPESVDGGTLMIHYSFP